MKFDGRIGAILVLLTLGLPLCGRADDDSGRVTLRFDSGWHFHRGDASGAEAERFDDARWRTVQLPHDGSIEDLPPVETANQPAIDAVTGAWKFQPGDKPEYKDPKLDDSTWQVVQLPAHWSAFGYNQEKAFAWFRRRISVPPELVGKPVVLLLGKIDDCDETFVNGVKVGGLGALPPHYETAWTVSRRYTVPAGLLKGDGTDVIAVRDYNGDADAGIYATAPPPFRSGPFDSDSPGGTAQGYTLGGIGWYRKGFELPAAWKEKRRVALTFDGVYMNATIYLNGVKVAAHPYGYTSFQVDLTPVARFGHGRNLLAVKVDASGKTSRWYSGAGIYRHVWLEAVRMVHVAPWGVAVSTPVAGIDTATVHVQTSLANADSAPADALVTERVVGPDGRTVVSQTGSIHVDAGGSADLGRDLLVAKPQLWSPESPTLYRLVTTVLVNGTTADEVTTPFGIRTISFDAAHGFQLNGKPVKLRGGCVHHDNGPLGSAAYDRAEERRVQTLKLNGFNAIRTSHNPPSPAFLDACDRLGMLVLDEAFDCWRHGKNPDDYGRFFDDNWKSDLDSMLLRDRNHPSVIMWSIGNEIPEQTTAEGAATAAQLADEVHRVDPTRPVTQATNPDADKLEPLLEHLDVTGYNYAASRFAADHEKHPDRVFIQTESFPQGAYDAWMTVRDNSFVVGDFVWTALDYLGEAGIGKAVPQSYPAGTGDNRLWTVSNCGDFDLSLIKRPQCYYRQAVWGVGARLSAFVEAPGPDGKPQRVEGWGWRDERPSWTWPGLEGKTLTVRAYSNYPQVRLLLNGQDLGAQPTNRGTRFTAQWNVPYAAGTLVAVGLDASGKETERWSLRTTGSATLVQLSPDRTTLIADGEDLAFINVDLVDLGGTVDPNASNAVQFTLTGPGEIVAVGNGDPRSNDSFQKPERKAFRGHCLVVIRTTEKGGKIQLRAESAGLEAGTVELTSAP